MKENTPPHQATINRLKGTIAGLQSVFKTKPKTPFTVSGQSSTLSGVIAKLTAYDATLTGVGTAKSNYQKVSQEAKPMVKEAKTYLLSLGEVVKQILVDPNLVAQCGFKVTTPKPRVKDPAAIAKGAAARAQEADGKAAAKATRQAKSGKAMIDLDSGEVEILPDAPSTAPDAGASGAPPPDAATLPAPPAEAASPAVAAKS